MPFGSPPAASPALLLELTQRYTEPHRQYHGLPHIAWMLDARREVELSEDQVLAVWFHDAVYEVPGPENEALSAALAVERLTAAGFPAERCRVIERIILDTRDHIPRSAASEAVIDLDLASLALPRAAFERNGARIRAEFACFDDATFAAGRIAFMRAFLARERIYWTPWGARLEARARENLRLDIERLQAELGASAGGGTEVNRSTS
ncbi:MAG: N-methyl-D-aspartate receptor NMDAR2C subunit [Planctomycetota bacterium]